MTLPVAQSRLIRCFSLPIMGTISTDNPFENHKNHCKESFDNLGQPKQTMIILFLYISPGSFIVSPSSSIMRLDLTIHIVTTVLCCPSQPWPDRTRLYHVVNSYGVLNFSASSIYQSSLAPSPKFPIECTPFLHD